MSYVKIWIHAVWGIHNREPVLSAEIRPVIFSHILNNAREKGIYLDFINGYFDHVHCLLTLNADLTLSKTIQLIKGEASHWANKEKLITPKLTWADDYFAVSVSESMVEKVRNYIRNQEEHHRKKSFAEECREFMTRYGFSRMQDEPHHPVRAKAIGESQLLPSAINRGVIG